jgi:dihydrofolate synthase/folylpolyglutamate synthase
MTYQEAIKYIEGLQRFGMQLGLERITYLLDLIGNPHQQLKCIHIAGTNGKGSTAVFIASILKYSGYTVGCYTSPHLIKFNERIVINNTSITDIDVANLVENIAYYIDKYNLKITYFEAATAIALLYFAKSNVDFVVLEVGLGGRLDATNVIIPELSVITNIELEHTSVLGDTIEKIAYEKAGIIKHGIPVVCGIMHEEAINVIKDIADNNNSKVYLVAEKVNIKPNMISTEHHVYPHINLTLIGKHQLENAACAVLSAEVLAYTRNIPIDFDIIPEALNNTYWYGRLQVIQNKPMIVLDGAHNPASIRALRQTINEYFSFSKLIFVLGILNDKDVKQIIMELLVDTTNIRCLILTKPEINRALSPEIILDAARKYNNVDIKVYETVSIAITQAINFSSHNDLICITGSLYIVGEALKWFGYSKTVKDKEV